MRSVDYITMDVADCRELNVNGEQIVATSVIEREGGWVITMTLYEVASGLATAMVAYQRNNQSYFHEIFAPTYRRLCERVGATPRIKE